MCTTDRHLPLLLISCHARNNNNDDNNIVNPNYISWCNP